MLAARLLDVLLVLVLLAYLVIGYRDGFARTLGALIGMVVGATVVFLGVPLLVTVIPSPTWRIVVTIALTVLLFVGGHSAGFAIGKAIRKRMRARRPLAVIDRLGGAAIGVVAAALASSLVIGSLGALGAPIISQASGGSYVVQGITALTPGPVQTGIARIRSLVIDSGLPAIGEALGGVTTSPGAPQVDTGTGSLSGAARSVVRINGTAYACGQNQSGSGAVVAANRIVTNAHVVAGVSAPVVEAPNGQAVQARVVYFDPVADIAVLATSGLSVGALPLSSNMAVGATGVIDGYPYGGPFHTGGAKVLAVSTEQVDDIYGSSRNDREIYTLAAEVEPGNSGGPLLTSGGQIAGLVFAENAKDAELGYAMTTASLRPIIARAPGLTTSVGAGHCTRG